VSMASPFASGAVLAGGAVLGWIKAQERWGRPRRPLDYRCVPSTLPAPLSLQRARKLSALRNY